MEAIRLRTPLVAKTWVDRTLAAWLEIDPRQLTEKHLELRLPVIVTWVFAGREVALDYLESLTPRD